MCLIRCMVFMVLNMILYSRTSTIMTCVGKRLDYVFNFIDHSRCYNQYNLYGVVFCRGPVGLYNHWLTHKIFTNTTNSVFKWTLKPWGKWLLPHLDLLIISHWLHVSYHISSGCREKSVCLIVAPLPLIQLTNFNQDICLTSCQSQYSTPSF